MQGVCGHGFRNCRTLRRAYNTFPPTGPDLLSGKTVPTGPMTPAGDRKGRPYAKVSDDLPHP